MHTTQLIRHHSNISIHTSCDLSLTLDALGPGLGGGDGLVEKISYEKSNDWLFSSLLIDSGDLFSENKVTKIWFIERFSLSTYGGRLDPIPGLCYHQMPRRAPGTWHYDYEEKEKSCSMNSHSPDGRQGSKIHSWLSYCGHSAQQLPHPSSHGRCTPAITTLISGPQISNESSNLVVFWTGGNEGLVKTTKAAVDRVKALGDPHKLPNKGPKSLWLD